MRNLAAALAIALLTALGVASPAAAAQTSTTKIVIVVGATHSATASYRADADSAYAEAIKYTPNVIKVYSPNATWTRVKAAAFNANILIYFGHGNGWPSPYPNDPTYSTKDGMGLNADLNGDGKLSDYENKYYGEPYMAQLHLAPNAIVMLNHLCYASGNNESGVTPEPTVSVARHRIDNYAAGFLKGGARAVLAEGHMGLEPYLRALFTTGQTIFNMWRTAPSFNGHASSFVSSRTPGYIDYSDSDYVGRGYYRSLVVMPGLTTTAATNAVGDTGVDPASLVFPGRAIVDAPDAQLQPATNTMAMATPVALPLGTRVRTVATAVPATATQPALIQVQGLDDPTIAGVISAADLAPRDSRAPVLVALDSGLGRLSPNGDGRVDEQAVSGIFSESVAWTVEFKKANGTVINSTTGTASAFKVTWDGLFNGVAVPDGTYSWTVRGTDAWQNGTATGGGPMVVDTTGPVVTGLSPDAGVTTVFSPNGDGVTDTIPTIVTIAEPGTIAATVTNAAGATIRTFAVAAVAGANTVTWDGKSATGAYVPGGVYVLHFRARDKTGNDGPAVQRPVRAMTSMLVLRTR